MGADFGFDLRGGNVEVALGNFLLTVHCGCESGNCVGVTVVNAFKFLA